MEWTVTGNKLTREFECKDFNSAVQLFNMIAIVSENEDHHPDILLFGYKKVKVMLFTHSVSSITEKDYQLARQIDELYHKMNSQ